MDAFDKLVEKHFPQAGPLQMLMEMVGEIMLQAIIQTHFQQTSLNG